ADTDGDGVNDGEEVKRGSDPNDPTDKGEPPPPGEVVQLRLTVGDHSGSHSERWNLVVGSIRHQAPEFGKLATGEYGFARGHRYPVTIEHAGTDPAYAAGTDYDYTATIEAVDPSVAIEL